MEAQPSLGASEIVAGRPFTNPEQSLEDVGKLSYMIEALRAMLQRLPDEPATRILEAPGQDGRGQRIVISKWAKLRAAPELFVVGFFGQKRMGVNGEPMDEMDQALIGEFDAHPGVLSYSSLELADGNWGNLVLLADEQTRDHWRTSPRHMHAAQDLSPHHYLTIRLHNGLLPGGLWSGREVVLLRTKYYDFQSQPAWKAVREFQPG